MRLLTFNSAKTAKGQDLGYLTGILYLHPGADPTLCPSATPACRAACLVRAGRARMFAAVEAARRQRTAFFRDDPLTFEHHLLKDLQSLRRRAERLGMRAALRLNGTSDVAPQTWQYVYALAKSYGITTYEYTKRRDVTRVEDHTTYSMTAADPTQIMPGQANALVFDVGRSRPLPTRFLGLRVIDGDKHDLRFLDREENEIAPNETYIVGLRLKRTVGDAVARRKGFAV